MGKYIDNTAIMQVIGGIYNNPSFLELTDKYHFNEADFVENLHKVIFGAIYNLYTLGAKEININTIEDYLESRPKKFAVYKVNNGAEYIKKLSQNTTVAAFDYYYARMKKMTLLRMYQRAGFDLSWLYDTDNIFDPKKKQQQEEWLDNTKIEAIADIIDKKIAEVRLRYVDNEENNIVEAGTGLLELIADLQKHPEMGYPLFGPLINTVTRGARLKKLYLRSASTGLGKALPNSTIIPTPQGFKRVGDVKVGDYLFDAFGKPTLVTGVYPQGVKEVWEVTFKDNRKAKCCEEHLWSYCTKGQKMNSWLNRNFYTSSLKEINEMELYRKGGGYQILVPMQKAVEYSEKIFYIAPYVLGLLLGDGSFRFTKSNKALSFSSEDEQLPSALAKEMGWIYKKNSEKNYNWYFEDPKCTSHINVWVEEVLKDYPNLINCKSEDKFIPRDYLESSIQQRFDLLNGLLDTDGSVDAKGRISYFTVSPQLRDNVLELCFSLGLKATYMIDTHKKDSLPLYIIDILGSPEDKIKLFKLKRKHDLIVNWYNNGKRKELNLFNPIIKIEKLDYLEEMTCFYVENDEHLFLMNDYIVTHNSRAMIADACTVGCDEMYDVYKNEWISTNPAQPTLYITTEQELSEVQTMMLAFISGVNEEHILNNKYAEGEIDRVLRAAQIIQKGKVLVEEIPDFSLQDIENAIKRSIFDYGTKYVFFDYLHSTLKILEEVSTKANVKGLREDNVLFMISITLKDLCNKYGIFIMTSTQLSNEYHTAQIYDQSLLRGAKSIADKVDWGSIMLEVSDEDLQALEDVITKGGFERPTIKMAIYKNRRGRYKNILLWCKDNRGICRIEPMFATNYKYELIPLDDTSIQIKDSLESAF